MDAKSRLIATLFIWTLATVAVSSMNDPFHDDIAGFGIVAGLILLCMGFIWNWGSLPLQSDKPAQTSTRSAEKTKRSASDKVAILRELLDDDELDALKSRLADDMAGGSRFDDGELSLSQLLEQDKR